MENATKLGFATCQLPAAQEDRMQPLMSIEDRCVAPAWPLCDKSVTVYTALDHQ